ncbi:hypothetical protein M951_chr2135 (nucleomorph) [Lotharella oceanica]|uniref:Uncharacterized protein n=1 Tax=Lotharella oceanica TaxID=641309 RepID=A0A060DBG5_9EUKA|nr:hypothetical protein M951_chr2135 [Lotharella oceanica]|mmetsp:Transcript_24259/g.45369  ORF Transcript_24259/g.45369 Transcript_24259/m.45369 type:complete len:127 (-) Transcript_24259:4139-4519(-)
MKSRINFSVKKLDKKYINIISNFSNYSINKSYNKNFFIYKKYNKKMASVNSLINKKTYKLEIIKIVVNNKIKNKFKICDIVKNTIIIVKNPYNYIQNKYKYVYALVTNDPSKCEFVNAILLDNILN